MDLRELPELMIRFSGAGQIVLVIGSLAIPRILGWSEDVAKLRPLTRQVFWVYAGYIWMTNLAFGLVSTLAPRSLLEGSTLATAVSTFIALYWAIRLVVQFAYFDRSDVPNGVLLRCAEWCLVSLFVFLTGVYLMAVGMNVWRAAR